MRINNQSSLCFASTATNALVSKYSEASLMILGFLIAAEFIETLSAPALSKACMFSIDEFRRQL